MCKYVFCDVALVDHRLGVRYSLRESARLAANAEWAILGLVVVASFVRVPFISIAFDLALVYVYKKQQEATTGIEHETGTSRAIKADRFKVTSILEPYA